MKRKCKNCQNDFNTFASKVKRGEGKFCSRICQNGGIYNPAYKGNKRLTAYQQKVKQMKKNPKRFRAMDAVKRAIKNCRLVRKECEKCDENKSEAHHPDYDRPLEVRWFCRKHHIEIHKNMKS